MDFFDRINRFANQFGELIADDVRAHVELGAALLDRGDLDGAIHELSPVAERRKDHPRALYLLGVAYLRRRALGDAERAEAALQQALAVRVDYCEAQVALGQLKEQQGDPEGAAEAYRLALPLAVDDGLRREVERALGGLYLRSGRLDKAVRELRKAVAGDPDDAEAQGLLGQALIESAQKKGEPDGGPTWEAARLCLQRAARTDRPSPQVLAALGRVLLQAGQVAESEKAFQRALATTPQQLQALLGLGLLYLQRGDPALAYEQALRAASAPGGAEDAEVRLLLARCYRKSGSPAQALAAYQHALGALPATSRLRRTVLEEALRVALHHGLWTEAAALGKQPPLDRTPDGLAAQARAPDLWPEQAEALISQALSLGDSIEVRLAQAALEQRRNNNAGAARALRRAAALAPQDPRPRALLRQHYQAERGALPREVYGLLQCAQRHFLRSPELAQLLPEVSQLVATLDRPLLLTVMGEFNSGKSTFVNALLGEEIAPMGITPTTATINILKYGRERSGRVVYRDDSSRDVPWAEVAGLLRALDEAEVRRIRYVEVLYPADMLQRVNVVDTPGLNSILPEHEQTAREFIAQADAVVWLCTVDQAGKASEREALQAIRDSGQREILGVLNKIDRLGALQGAADGKDPQAQVMQHLLDPVEGMGSLLEDVVPFSGRDALRGRLDGDAERLQRSNLAGLEQTLNERFFARSQAIKRQVARTRLLSLLERARTHAEALLQRNRRQGLEDALATATAEAERFRREVLPTERRRLIADSEEVHTVAARETLDFVRPRRWPFGDNQASPADRDFLVGLLDEKLHALVAASRERVVQALGEQPQEALQLLDEQVYGRYLAFSRGYLRGGKVDDFFVRLLPRLELTESAIGRALERDAPTSIDILEAELLTPLLLFSTQRFQAILTERRRALEEDDLTRFDLEERLIEPLDALLSALNAL